MTFLHFYTQLLKSQANYNIVFSSLKYQLFFNLCSTYCDIFKLNVEFFYKLLKNFFVESGLKTLLFKNWSNFGLKYNIIFNLLKVNVNVDVDVLI